MIEGTTEFFPESPELILKYSSKFSTVLNILRFLGYYGLKNNAGFPFSWLENYLSNDVINSVTFIYPFILGISVLCLSKEKNQKVRDFYLLLMLLLLSLIMLMKGVNEPLPESAYLLLKIHPIFFRHPYTRFAHLWAFLYILILSYVLKKMLERKLTFSGGVILAFLLLLLSYPLFTGEVIHSYDRLDLSNTSYLRLKNEVNLDSNFRALVIPFVFDTREYSYTIAGRINHPNDKSLIHSFIPNISILQFPRTSIDNNFLKNLYKLMIDNDFENFLKYLELFSIKYLIYHKDFSEALLSIQTIERSRLQKQFISELEEKQLILKIFESDEIAVYEIAGLSIIPLITTNPQMNVTSLKLNPTLYIIRVNASDPFILRFCETYDPMWEARVYKNGKLVEKVSPIPLYGIINGFPINATGENVEIVIRYIPQDWFEIGLAVSGLAFTFCILYLFYDWRRSKGDRWVKKLEGRLKTRLTSKRDDASVRSVHYEDDGRIDDISFGNPRASVLGIDLKYGRLRVLPDGSHVN
ncbi:MAG: hypothetical protein QW491_10860 [Thermoproteota archaeon]|nr:hypothetical protein [Candidatus Brockarchaeota archaeon]